MPIHRLKFVNEGVQGLCFGEQVRELECAAALQSVASMKAIERRRDKKIVLAEDP